MQISLTMISRAAVVLSVVCLLGLVSGIKLEGNGYTNVLFAINPKVTEDPKLIDKIKEMVKDSSEYLFEASSNRFYFKQITILVPPTWKNGNYSRARTETYDKANIIIDEPNRRYGDEPYTLQYGACGEPGKHIHLTPNFLLDDNLEIYGPRGRLLVHEWAHLRWGVYDEYDVEVPFYMSASGIEATRCSNEITGGAFEPVGSGQFQQKCVIDPGTGLYKKDCKFYPDKHQTATSSIMYLQALDTVTKFCNEKNHNRDAPNMQNKMCNFRSTEEVILSDSVDNNTAPMQSRPPSPIISVVRKSGRVICLVLDVSGSMGGGRILRQRQAATLFLQQIIEDLSYVGIVTFTHVAQIREELTLLDSDADRQRLVNRLPTSANGGTDICAGLHKGFEVLRKDNSNTEGDEIVFLTDGESEITCINEVANSGSIVHTIALGPVPHEALQEMAKMSGGKYFSAADSLDSNALLDAFASLTASDGDPTQQTIQLESSGKKIDVNGWFNGTVSVDRTVGNDTSFLVLYDISPPEITIKDPSGKEYNEGDCTPDTTLKSLTLNIPGTAKRGDWTYSIFNTRTQTQSLTMTVTSRASSADVAPVMVKAHMSQQSSDGSKPMVVFAEVSQKGLPVTMANVTATIVSSDGDETELQLEDDGAAADVFKHDGIYSKYFTNIKSGKFTLKVKVKDQGGQDKPAIRRHSRAFYIPGYVVDGKVEPNPPKPPINEDDLHVDVGSFTRTVTGESFTVSLPPGVSPPNYPPNKITDLSAKLEEDKVIFTWTAPGADLDQGTAKAYEIRMAEDLDVIRNNFSYAHPINTSSIKPQQAGSVEQYAFTPDNGTIQNGTTLYFAIRAEDIDSMVSDISNIAQVAKFVPFIPPPPPPPVKPTGKPPAPSSGGSVNITAIVISVTVVVVASSVIISAIACIRNRRERHASNVPT